MITRGMGSRPFTLEQHLRRRSIFGWPVLVMSLLGLADSRLRFRGPRQPAGAAHPILKLKPGERPWK
jgi:hypothetical protein